MPRRSKGLAADGSTAATAGGDASVDQAPRPAGFVAETTSARLDGRKIVAAAAAITALGALVALLFVAESRLMPLLLGSSGVRPFELDGAALPSVDARAVSAAGCVLCALGFLAARFGLRRYSACLALQFWCALGASAFALDFTVPSTSRLAGVGDEAAWVAWSAHAICCALGVLGAWRVARDRPGAAASMAVAVTAAALLFAVGAVLRWSTAAIAAAAGEVMTSFGSGFVLIFGIVFANLTFAIFILAAPAVFAAKAAQRRFDHEEGSHREEEQ